MKPTIEIVRFEVPPERAGVLVDGHGGARRAIDALSPGWIWSRLARSGERGWVEIVAWRRRGAFDRAFELSSSDPVARPWFDLADPGWTIELGELMQASGEPPPRDGSLELTPTGSGGSGTDAALAAPAEGASWSALIELDGRIWRDPEAWEHSGPSLLRVNARQGVSARGAGTEAVEIVHSYDADEEAAQPA